MERLYSDIIGMGVYEDDMPRPVTTVQDIIMDYERGELIAFVVGRNKIVTPVDVLSFSNGIRINSADNIGDVSDVLRVEEILKSGVRIAQNKVETEGGEELGKVFDFAVDDKTYEFRKLYVAKGFLGLFRYDSRIIPSKNIIEILPDKIVVKDKFESVKEEIKEKGAVKEMAA